MNIVNLLRGAIALVAVALVSLIPYVGSIVIAPVVVLMISAEAGRRAAARAGSRPANEAAKAGAIVGVGALIGSIVGLTILLMFVVDIPSVQETIRNSEPNPEARIPYEWIPRLAALGGVVGGFLIGLFDLFLAILVGLLAGWIYNHNRRVPA